MTQLNVDLLRATLAYIEERPSEWHQGTWACRTKFCFAGHAAVTLSGGVQVEPCSSCLKAEADDLPADVLFQAPDGEVVSIQARATRLLGLSEVQAESLFAGYNSLDRLRELVGDLCREAEGG